MGRATTAASGAPSRANGSSAKPSSLTGRRTGSGSSSKRRRRRTARRLFRFDEELGSRFIAGADEAGRGSLAGPLVAAAVLLDYDRLGRPERRALHRLDDSKQKTEAEREELYPAVIRAAERVAVTARCVRGIDARGLHVTNLAALADCLQRVARGGARCLVDGFRIPDATFEHTAVVDGDARSAAIAAASVIAKVTRDRYMRRAHGVFPGWGFHDNVGYSTEEHRVAIAEIGISAVHRRSFDSVAYKQLDLGA